MTEGDLTYRIATIPGDGVGPEVVEAARRVVNAAGARFGFTVEWSEYLVGGAAIDAYGVAIRPEDVTACGEADAILLGAVGGPKWSDPSASGPPGAGAVRAARRPGTVREPAAGQRPSGPGGRVAAPARAPRRRGHAHRPRAHRRRLLRGPARGRRATARTATALDTLPYSAAGDPPHRRAGVRAGRRRGAAT